MKAGKLIVQLLFFIVLVSGYAVMAQEVQTEQPEEEQSSCAQTLVLAQELFSEGKINEVAPALQQCLVSGFEKAEKIEAYKLLSVAYAYLNDYDKADEAVLNLLRFENEYEVNEDIDPTEFIKLFQKFRIDPVFHAGIKFGLNRPLLNIGNTYEISPGTEGNAGVYELNNGLTAGIEFEIPWRKIHENFEFCPALTYSSKSWNIIQNYYVADTAGEIGGFTGTEVQTWLELPLMARWKFNLKDKEGNIREDMPFVELGPSFNFLLASSLTELKADAPGEGAERGDVDITGLRKRLNYGFQIGAGYKMNIPMAVVVVKGTFNLALNQLNVRNSPPSELEEQLRNQLGYSDNDFRINYFTLTVGYMRKIYKPKKIIE